VNAPLHQPALFVDTSEDAVRDTVRGLGGAKVVGPALWPAKKPDRAERDLLDCLNANNPRELSFDEIMLIGELGRDKGLHLIAGFVNMRLGYAPPVPVDPQDARAELQRQFIDAVDRVERLGRVLKVRA
jgi:hypothetical protein